MMKRTWTIRTGGVTVAVALGTIACAGSDSAPHPPQAQAAVETRGAARAVFEIQGMACLSCAATVRAMLVRTPGVARADVSAERGEGIVEFDPAQVAPAELIAVVERLGYRARPKDEADGNGVPGS